MALSLFLSFVFANSFNLQNVDSLRIEANQANISLAKASESGAKWQSSKSWKLLKKNDQIVLSYKGDEKADLKLFLPKITLKIYTRTGFLKINQAWAGDLVYRGIQLSLDTKSSEGQWDIHGQNLDIQVFSHKGDIQSLGSKGEVQLKEVFGNLNIEQYSGELNLSELEGDITIKTNQTKTKISKSKGSLDYDSQRGEIVIQDFAGRLKGNSAKGLSIVNPAANAKVYWRADQGGLRLGVRKISGAYIDIATKEGNLFLVPPLRAKNEGIWRVARAKLKGSNPGSVRVRTNKADVRLKFD